MHATNRVDSIRGSQRDDQEFPRPDIETAHRLKTAKAQLSVAPSSVVLHLVNNHGGGTQRYIESIVRYTNSQNRHFVLYLGKKQQILWDVWQNHYQPLSLFDEAEGWQSLPLLNFLLHQPKRRLSVHLHSMFAEALSFAESLPAIIPMVATLHDHYFLSDRAFSANQITKSAAHIQRVQTLLQRASAVIVPSTYLFEQAKPYFSQAQLHLIPHGSDLPYNHLSDGTKSLAEALMQHAGWNSACRTVGFIGAFGTHKGLDEVKQLTELFNQDGVQVALLGFTSDRVPPEFSQGQIQHGPYDYHEIPGLIKYYGIDVIIFPPAIPESFCYALSDICGTVAVLAPDVGALKYRVIEENLGTIYAVDLKYKQLKQMAINAIDEPMIVRQGIIHEENVMAENTEKFYNHITNEAWEKQKFTSQEIDDFCRENLSEEMLRNTLVNTARENFFLRDKEAGLRKELTDIAQDNSALREQLAHYHNDIVTLTKDCQHSSKTLEITQNSLNTAEAALASTQRNLEETKVALESMLSYKIKKQFSALMQYLSGASKE